MNPCLNLLRSLRQAVGIALLTCALTAHGEPADNRNLTIKIGSGPAATTERRVALVIGNSAYQRGPLKNPVNDATDVAAKLRSMGFEVIERTNLKSGQIGRTLREFRSRLTPGSVALFFYAGHGLQIKGENYLPTIDADIEGEEDVPNQSIAVRQVMEVMADAKTRLNLAFLDACRNNPYARSFRSGTEGLARVSAPSGTLISFATRPGSVAADGTGRNGLYTTHLLAAMETPNLPVELMLKKVTSGVKVASQGMQEPWMEGSIDGDFQFLTVAPQKAEVHSAADAERSRKEAIERAVQEALRYNNEQAARERAELQASLRVSAAEAEKSRKEAVERAVQEALRHNNEQAAKERAELQASVQKLIQDALARQNAQASHASSQTVMQPQVVASMAPSGPANPARPMIFMGGATPSPGDEWEYLSREAIFGKQHRLLWRVRAVDTSVGVLEELQIDGKTVLARAFNGEPDVIGVQTDTGLFFGPHWVGDKLPTLYAKGLGDCANRLRCEMSVNVKGRERISVPAGTFDAIRIEGTYSMTQTVTFAAGYIKVWYSEKDRRLLKQTVTRNAFNAIGARVEETIELQSIRLTAR